MQAGISSNTTPSLLVPPALVVPNRLPAPSAINPASGRAPLLFVNEYSTVSCGAQGAGRCIVGFTPSEALASATINTAVLVGADGYTGSIAVGKNADLAPGFRRLAPILTAGPPA